MEYMDEYQKFLKGKERRIIESGFDVLESDLNPKLFDFQKFCVKRALRKGKYALFESCGLGKEQPYSEPVLTPDGYVNMGDLRVGDYVVARNGKKTKVLNIYEQGEKDVYKVTFSDGTYTRCGIEHLWTVKTLYGSKKIKTLPLKDIIKDYKRERQDKRGYVWNAYKYSIPVCDAVEFNAYSESEKLHPYILGVILGDGCISQHSVSICKPNQKLRDKIESLVQNGDVVSGFHADLMTFMISNKTPNQTSWTKKELIRLGLMGTKSKDKFIPSEYLFASINDRMDLLQGLIDTDGHIVSNGLIEYSTSSLRLKNDIEFLARSLGYIVRTVERDSYYNKDGDKFHNYRIFLYKNARKIKNIVNIELCGREQSRCIMVDNDEHLYLTRDFIVTHNTIQQLEWARQVNKHTGKPVLVLAPLSVSMQTIDEGVKFGIEVRKYNGSDFPIQITNYEQLDNIDCSLFSGVVLDESSILKSFDGSTKKKIIESFKDTPYKLACTATPSPNDPMELGNHAEFLDVMSYNEMLAMYFVHDGGDTSKWRLKGHATESFYKFVGTWSVMFSKPSDIGFPSKGYELPPLNYIEEQIVTPKRNNGKLFNDNAVNATNFNQELRDTMELRLRRVVDIVNSKPNEPFIIWIKQNQEGEMLRKLLPEAIEVKGSDSDEWKEDKLLGFAKGEFRVLITKTKIASFGMNYQNCNNQIFASLDFSFEGLYQAIRRCYRFGQEKQVNIYLITTDTMTNVKQTIDNKQKKFEIMQATMSKTINENLNNDFLSNSDCDTEPFETDFCSVKRGDCVQLIKNLKDESIGLSIFSPPFAELYTYSNYVEDMGNSKDYKEFLTQFEFLVNELYRVMMSGRNVCVHCMDLPIQKGKEGYIGLRDFSGMILDIFEKCGFIYHSRITIWKDPVVEMQRTKALGLLHKQIKKDSTMCRVGIPDYVMVFRKDGDRDNPVRNENMPVDLWQKIASPVWMDINQSNTLQGMREAREDKDEKHICPLQLDVIERCIMLYSNEGDRVFTPFMGIGSEVYQSVKMNRFGIGFELKDSYYEIAVKNIRRAIDEKKQITLF